MAVVMCSLKIFMLEVTDCEPQVTSNAAFIATTIQKEVIGCDWPIPY